MESRLVPVKWHDAVRLRSGAMTTVLLTGATGFVGSRLRPVLERRRLRVRCLSRDAARAERRFPGSEWLQADLADPVAVRKAMQGCDAAYYLVHEMGSGSDYREREAAAARIFAHAAADAGLRRIIYLGGVAPGEATGNFSRLHFVTDSLPSQPQGPSPSKSLVSSRFERGAADSLRAIGSREFQSVTICHRFASPLGRDVAPGAVKSVLFRLQLPGPPPPQLLEVLARDYRFAGLPLDVFARPSGNGTAILSVSPERLHAL